MSAGYFGSVRGDDQRFLKRHVTDAVKFVNREEDMGIEGLRKSKMSYYPLRLVKKYRIIEND